MESAIPINGLLTRRIAILGFGEVGGIFANDLSAAGRRVIVYDSLVQKSQIRESLSTKAQTAKVELAETLESAVQESDLVLSSVTASSAVQVAKQAAAVLRPSQIYMDMNSVSPATKREIGAEIARSGAEFVEAAVMAAVKPSRLKVPILLGGVRACALAEQLRILGMDTTAVSEKLGDASAIKMCRSILMKGLAALTIESLFAARRYGAEDAVISSFEATYPGMGWGEGLPDALTYRAVEHSRRRAAEMREVVETLRATGMNSAMASATAELQDWLSAEMESRNFAFKKDEPFSWRTVADAIVGSPDLGKKQ